MRTHLGPIGMSMALAALGCLMFTLATPAQAAKGANGEEHKVDGKITSMSKRSITISVHKKKSSSNAKGSNEKTFEVGKHTKVFMESKQGKQPSSLSELKDGEYVVIEARGKHANVIVIHHHHKKKKSVA